jgi:Carboxypeptidase regulatory-like domain
MALLATAAAAQDKKHEAQLRTVRGVVTDKSDNLLNGSVVFLKNMRTNSVRSSYTDDTGSYRFSGLDPNADYELHAERENEKSTTRTVSSFDSRKDIVLNLKIDKKKSWLLPGHLISQQKPEETPNYGTVEKANALPPLSTGQKFPIATASVFDWGTYPFNGTLSAIAQARNDPKEWGQGWDAYGKRFGANFADNSIGTYMTVATCLRRVG